MLEPAQPYLDSFRQRASPSLVSTLIAIASKIYGLITYAYVILPKYYTIFQANPTEFLIAAIIIFLVLWIAKVAIATAWRMLMFQIRWAFSLAWYLTMFCAVACLAWSVNNNGVDGTIGAIMGFLSKLGEDAKKKGVKLEL